MITCQTATDIAMAYREIETGEALLIEIAKEVERSSGIDIRDAFGRRQNGLQLAVPNGQNGHRLFNVPWSLARPIIETHIAQQKALVALLTERALVEAANGRGKVEPL